MNFLPLIEAKRDGLALQASQITEAIRAYTAGKVPDYQLSAFLMAVVFRGLTADETAALTLAMRDSGEVLQLPPDPRPLVDKHSTGGVGDKVSLPLAPLLACLGFRVPMISGRGLGITGGTLDKLDSIPGFRTHLSVAEIIETVQRVGCVICGQTELMVPADRKLYALRDVTGTIASVPLIVASILSKKLAEGICALLLDVKFGAAAFMPTLNQARELAAAMVELGRAQKVNTRALLTRMDSPLGRAAGNWLEVKEAMACLENRGPADLKNLVVASAAQLLVQGGGERDLDQAMAKAEACLASGAPRKKWDELLAAQGADPNAVAQVFSAETSAPVVRELTCDREAFVAQCNARAVGELIRELGGGRWEKDAQLDYAAGVDCLAKPGEYIRAGDLLGRIHAGSESKADTALKRLKAAFSFTEEPPNLEPLISEVIVT